MKRQNLIFQVSGNELHALTANCGAFSDCNGFDAELLKRGSTVFEDSVKFTVTRGNFELIYSNLTNDVINASKYPNRRGKEFDSFMKVKSILEAEYVQQTGEKLST